MRELRSVAAWLAEGTPHQLDYVETLPNPTFRAYGQEQVSFSSNNYLALSASPRLIAAAHEGVTRYGVGNCESRLLGGNLEIDLTHRKVERGGKTIFLSPTEFSLLEILAERTGEAVDRQEILRRIWNTEDRDPNIVDVYITYLRKKTERSGEPRLIQTVRGHGYSLRDMSTAS